MAFGKWSSYLHSKTKIRVIILAFNLAFSGYLRHAATIVGMPALSKPALQCVLWRLRKNEVRESVAVTRMVVSQETGCL